MAFPVTPPVLTQEESIEVITEAEAGIAQCMAEFICNEIFPGIALLTDVNEQVELAKSILCAYTCKEQGIAAVLKALSKKIYADKGLLPGGDGDPLCSCD